MRFYLKLTGIALIFAAIQEGLTINQAFIRELAFGWRCVQATRSQDERLQEWVVLVAAEHRRLDVLGELEPRPTRAQALLNSACNWVSRVFGHTSIPPASDATTKLEVPRDNHQPPCGRRPAPPVESCPMREG